MKVPGAVNAVNARGRTPKLFAPCATVVVHFTQKKRKTRGTTYTQTGTARERGGARTTPTSTHTQGASIFRLWVVSRANKCTAEASSLLDGFERANTRGNL